MEGIKEYLEQQTGEQLGVNIELSFDELGVSQRSLQKRAGKVGLKAKLTEFWKAAQRRSGSANPIAPNQADIVKWVLYDRFIFAASTTVPNNFKFFTQPIGTAGKTKIDTNLDQVQRLPDPLWFNTEGLGFYFSNKTSITDMTAFLDSEYMEYWVGQKIYLEGPIQVFPGGAGIFGTVSVTGTADAAIASNGLPMSANVYDCRLPAGIH